MTQPANVEAIRGWVLYDGDCALCVGAARRFGRMLEHRHFALAPFQAPWVRERIGWDGATPLREMALLTNTGGRFGGADALVEIARSFWWAWPLVVLSKLPGGMTCLRSGYGWMADHRHCLNGACSLASGSSDRVSCPHRSRVFFDWP